MMAQPTDHCIKDLDDMYSSELKRWDMFASAPGTLHLQSTAVQSTTMLRLSAAYSSNVYQLLCNLRTMNIIYNLLFSLSQVVLTLYF